MGKRKETGEPKASKKPSLEDFRKACKMYDGVVSTIASAFKVSRTTVNVWCNGDPLFREALDESREVFLDVAESRLYSMIKGIPIIEKNAQGQHVQVGWEVEPNITAVLFFLKTKGRHRGYSERMEVENNIKGSINIDEWIKTKIK